MITIIPGRDVMKTVTDKNIGGDAAEERNRSFAISNELMAEANVDILVPSQLYDLISGRLNEDHKSAFESLYKIDNSTQSSTIPYDIDKAIGMVSEAESKARGVVIITSNPTTYSSLDNDRIKVVTPQEFNSKVTLARSWKKRGVISLFDDILWIIFFKNS